MNIIKTRVYITSSDRLLSLTFSSYPKLLLTNCMQSPWFYSFSSTNTTKNEQERNYNAITKEFAFHWSSLYMKFSFFFPGGKLSKESEVNRGEEAEAYKVLPGIAFILSFILILFRVLQKLRIYAEIRREEVFPSFTADDEAHLLSELPSQDKDSGEQRRSNKRSPLCLWCLTLWWIQ